MKPQLLILLLMAAGPLSAQFDKYKTTATPSKKANPKASRTPAQEASAASRPPPSPTVSSPAVAPAPPPAQGPTQATAPSTANADAETDSFGRAVSPSTIIRSKKEGRFVNLNPETAFGPEVVTNFEFKNTPLSELTEQMQKLTGLNLILDKELKGRVTIHSPKAITVGEAWKAYLSALNMNGYALVKTGAFYKIVSTRDIRYTPTKIYTGEYTPNTENYAMRILPLKNINSTELTRSFRPFMGRYGRIIDIKQTNTVIIQDTGENINRLVRLTKFVDVPGHEESLQIIPIRHASAQEIAKLLDEILRSGPQPRRPTPRRRTNRGRNRSSNISKIIAEPRTNSIIAMANADGSRQLRELIQKLDVRSATGNGGQIHVYYLNHGDAESLSKTLSTLVSNAKAVESKNPPANPPRTIFSAAGGRGDPATLFSGPVKITADVDNNALVVTASPTDYLTIKSVIDKLDIPRDQVYVEGLIMETQIDKARGFGVSVVGAYGTGNAKRSGFIGGDDNREALTNLLIRGNPLSLGGLFSGFGLGREMEFPNPEPGGPPLKINSVNGLISAIANNTDSNILATPQILALDNTEAIFEVGENIPVLERSDTAVGSTTSTKERKVALSLKITPQINKVTRFVKLKINQKIEAVSNRPLPSGIRDQAVATTARSAETTVVVRDRDTVAMGGLMRDQEGSTVSKVPLLGDIPLLGWLFKNKETTVNKVNLLLFLTPKILANYQRDAASTVKDLLNRRNHHLKDVQGEDDPFNTSVKGLYEKMDRQQEAPLYDEAETQQFRDTNEGPGIGDSEMAPKEIIQKVGTLQAQQTERGRP